VDLDVTDRTGSMAAWSWSNACTPASEVPKMPLRNDSETMHCAVCGTEFRRNGRQRFCDGVCRQRSWRRRRPTPLPPIPERSPRPSTVYECPACATRYLGEQYCADCRTFCRRVGPGGPCPHCDEPVAITDLIA
jgi:hypothetical protein